MKDHLLGSIWPTLSKFKISLTRDSSSLAVLYELSERCLCQHDAEHEVVVTRYELFQEH